MDLKRWISEGPVVEYETDRRALAVPDKPLPASWAVAEREANTAYQARVRAQTALPLAMDGIRTIAEIHEYINSVGEVHPALAAELRRVESTLSSCVVDLIERYMGRS